MTEALRQEMIDVERELNEINPSDRSPETQARYVQLDVRRDLVRSRYRVLVSMLEERRLTQILDDAREVN